MRRSCHSNDGIGQQQWNVVCGFEPHQTKGGGISVEGLLKRFNINKVYGNMNMMITGVEKMLDEDK